jgi:oxygen-independent coproporphyrinogen-3 oxidase
VAFREARLAGFCNIGLDLIFGLPEQDRATWQTTLEQAIALRPDHLSLYCLTVEEGTSLARRMANGQVLPADDDLAADLYLQACDLLAAGGYQHYEISSWARQTSSADGADGVMACRHNLATWRNEPFLGFGAGAHSSLDGRRWWNVRSPTQYMERLGAGRSPMAGSEEIGEALAMGETMILGLRLVREGVATASFESRFGRSPIDLFSEQIATLEEIGLVERLPDRLRLSRRGRLLANLVFEQFLPS